MPCVSNEKPVDAAVSTPITWPELLIKAPPESPGWMLASVWIRPVSCSLVPLLSSWARIVCPRLVTWPLALIGTPPTPPALPSPTTVSPTCTRDESPMAAVLRAEAPCSLMTPMSWTRSYPITEAVYFWPLPMSVAVMLVAPEIT